VSYASARVSPSEADNETKENLKVLAPRQEFRLFDSISIGMTAKDHPDITGMLAAWNEGSAEALERVIDVIYPELRRIARKHLARRKPGESLESAALANEAYLKLLQSGGIRCENRTHFLALCSQMIRRILVDHARTNSGTESNFGVKC
jgi:hypothetical protein